MKNILKLAFCLLLPLKAYCHIFTAEENALVLDYCKEIAAKVDLPDAKFKIDDDFSYYYRPFQDAAGYYDPFYRFISLSPTTKSHLLNIQKNKLSTSPEFGQETISYANFALLHELGHHNSHIFARTLLFICGSIAVAENARKVFDTKIKNKLVPGKISLVSQFGIALMNIFLSRHIDEGYADRFAAKQLCTLYGYKKTQEYLSNAIKSESRRGLSLDSKLDGYYSYQRLLNYTKQLEKWSKNPIQSSFYINYSI